jgi:hypothetical protein
VMRVGTPGSVPRDSDMSQLRDESKLVPHGYAAYIRG